MKLPTPPLSLSLFPLLFAAACAGQGDTGSSGGDPDRAPLGKADTVGTCEGACDGPALYGNCWCDDLCESYGDCCSDKEDICESATSFISFETSTGGFCPPEIDCSTSIELLADGTLKVDLIADIGGGVHEALVSDDDLADAIAVLTASDLLLVLDGANPACTMPTDIFESMTLNDGDGVHRNSVTFCDDPSLQAARDVLNELRQKYIQTSSFVSFKTFRGGFCPPQIDCSGSIELLADGTLLVDRFDDIDGGIHSASVNEFDLRAAIKVLTDPGLLEVLDAGTPPCTPPTDIFESLSLVDADGEHQESVTGCGGAEIDAARATMNSLMQNYL